MTIESCLFFCGLSYLVGQWVAILAGRTLIRHTGKRRWLALMSSTMAVVVIMELILAVRAML